MSHRRARVALALAAATGLALAQGSVASAHVQKTAGGYRLEIGWHVEPTYVGQPNAVEITITDGSGRPVTDLGPDDLHATVSTGGQASPALTFDPAFDLAEHDGTPGQYIASILPTAPGDYTFEVKGTIHGTAVDVSVASSPTTFDPAVGTSEIEFPAKLPTAAEVATHLNRLDARVAAASASVADARSAADRALLVGGAIGAIGILLAVVAIVLGWRARSRRQRGA